MIGEPGDRVVVIVSDVIVLVLVVEGAAVADTVLFNLAAFCTYMKPSMEVLLKKQNHGRSPGGTTCLRRVHSAAQSDC